MTPQDELRGLDLNLLLALDALVEECSVTRAAARMGIGQSAMSSALARLRVQFGDEVLVRAADGMRPTPRALALKAPLRAVLRQIRSLVAREAEFDPATAIRGFSMAVLDGTEALFIPALLAICQARAPGMHIDVRAFDRASYADDLDADRLDLAVGFSMAGRGHHRQRLLYRDGYVVLYNDELLRIGATLSLDDYARLPHVVTSYGGASVSAVDAALATIGRTRRIAIRTPRFLMLPHIVAAAPVLATIGSRYAELWARSSGLTVSPVPLDLPAFATNMVWHTSYDDDPAHAWLRQTFVEVASRYVVRQRPGEGGAGLSPAPDDPGLPVEDPR